MYVVSAVILLRILALSPLSSSPLNQSEKQTLIDGELYYPSLVLCLGWHLLI